MCSPKWPNDPKTKKGTKRVQQEDNDDNHEAADCRGSTDDEYDQTEKKGAKDDDHAGGNTTPGLPAKTIKRKTLAGVAAWI